MRLFNRAAKPEPAKPAAPSLITGTASRLKAANAWRDQYNPLRALTIQRAISLLEQHIRGEFADLHWTYEHIEMTDATLMALIERRTSAIGELDWNIKTVSPDTPGYDQRLAEDQAGELRLAYDNIDNLNDAIQHLAMATFRGFAPLEKHGPMHAPTHLEVCDTWNIVRDGYRGPWKYNPAAKQATFSAIENSNLIDTRARWIMRECKRPVDRIALIAFVRANLCEKDWDAFVEIYGLPAWINIGPENVPADQQDEFRAAAERLAEGVSGYAPHGTSVESADSPRGSQPFRPRLEHLREQVVLAGTGGLLTMLSMPQGIGSGSSGAHEDTFRTIARAEARDISALNQERIDKPFLSARYPGGPQLAYWELAANEEQDPAAVIDDALNLSQAGYQMEAADLAERTGYKLSSKPPADPPQPLRNRAAAGVQAPASEQQLPEGLAEPARAWLQQALTILDRADSTPTEIRAHLATAPGILDKADLTGLTQNLYDQLTAAAIDGAGEVAK